MDEITKLMDELKQKRDELALQIHLGSMEARQEWNELETKWEDFVDRSRLEESAEGVASAIDLLGDELRRGYERLKKAL